MQEETALYSLLALGVVAFVATVVNDYRKEVKTARGDEDEDVMKERIDESDSDSDEDEVPALEERNVPSKSKPATRGRPAAKKTVRIAANPTSSPPVKKTDMNVEFYRALPTILDRVRFDSAESAHEAQFNSILDELKRRSSFKEDQESMRTARIIPYLKRIVLQTPNSTIATKAGFILSNISLLGSNQHIFSEEKILKVLFERSEEISFLYLDALQTLVNLSSRDDPILDDVVESRAIPRAIKTLSDKKSNQRVLISALNAFDNLSMHEQHRRSILEHGGKEVIQSFVDSKNASLSSAATNIIERLEKEENSDDYKLASSLQNDQDEFIDMLRKDIDRIAKEDAANAGEQTETTNKESEDEDMPPPLESRKENPVEAEEVEEIVVEVVNPFSILENRPSSEPVDISSDDEETFEDAEDHQSLEEKRVEYFEGRSKSENEPTENGHGQQVGNASGRPEEVQNGQYDYVEIKKELMNELHSTQMNGHEENHL